MMKHIVRCTASKRVNYNRRYLFERGYGDKQLEQVGKSTTSFWVDKIGKPDNWIVVVL